MQLKDDIKNIILFLLEDGMKPSQIAKKFKISCSTVTRLLEKYKNYKTLDHLKGNGRPKKMSSNIKNILEKENKINSMTSLRKMSKIIEEQTGVTLCPNTIRSYLNSKNIFAYKPLCKPLLRPSHVEARLACAKEWLFMDELSCKKIIFSDESKFNLFGSDGKPFTWREPADKLKNSNVIKTLKYGGGSIMVWGCFSYHGVGKLVLIDGIMTGERYVDILSRSLKQSAIQMGLNDFFFQQDNDPKHTSRIAKDYFEHENIKLLRWPAQSPDLNPIENLWGIIKRKICGIRFKNKNECFEYVNAEWEKIEVSLCQKLSESFRKRTLEVLKNRGGYINY